MAKILIIGFGSIGARHARVAAEAGHSVVVVSRRTIDSDFPVYGSIDEALTNESLFDAALIATETSRHREDLRALEARSFSGRVLVEKPLFSHIADQAPAFDSGIVEATRVAYNLRLHPLLRRLRDALAGAVVLNVVVHVGQDLRGWRDRDAASTYSVSRAHGGGVLRDLSHELDYLLWLFGPWRAVAAMGGKFGDLPGDADDAWGVLIHFESGAVAVLAMDYFCTRPVRSITVNTVRGTIQVDLIQGRIAGLDAVSDMTLDRDDTYRNQLAALLADRDELASFSEGLEVLRLIQAVETASAEQRTIHR